MNLFILGIILALPLLSHQNPRGTWTLLPNILVLDVDGTPGRQVLRCLEPPPDPTRSGDLQRPEIYWKKDGVEDVQTGNSYLVRLEESLGGGNYSCHSSNGSALNYTEVLIRNGTTQKKRILVKEEQEDYLKCFAQNYSGEFHCSWSWHRSRVGTVAFIEARRVSEDDDGARCSVDPLHHQRWLCSAGQRNFSCSVADDGRGVSCQDERHCPYAEENQQIRLTVYLRTKHYLLENYSRSFYLSQIVKPDKVTIAKVNITLIEWSYPSSWSSPYSYFPLTFQVAQFKGRCRTCSNPCAESKGSSKELTLDCTTSVCQFQVKRKSKAVCVRAQDALCDSQWSDWSLFRLKGTRRRNRGNKQQNKEQSEPLHVSHLL